ncbi:hypothetical protein ACSVHC_17190 [Arthrobacter sp. KNU-44]|uniref:hypothetical protein n=1 Tax=Arthrobacter sp. KNU-44 TaxID=3450744 RepID=UPI003F442080
MAILVSLFVLSEPRLPVGDAFLGIALVVLWLFVLGFRIKYEPTRRPQWRRYLWPLALPLAGLAIELRPGGGGFNPTVWIVIGIYSLAVLIITFHVWKLMRVAKENNYTFSGQDYRRALRTARAFSWIVPVFGVLVFASDWAFGSDGDLANKSLDALRNQLYGVIGASALIAALTAVPAETRSIVESTLYESRLASLLTELQSLSSRIDALGVNDIDRSEATHQGHRLRQAIIAACGKLRRSMFT